MKKLLITFLALGLISTLSCLPSEFQRSREEGQRFFDIYQAIVKIVDQLIRTVQSKLNQLVNDTAGVILAGIQSIENAIKEAIETFSTQVQNVQDQIDLLVTETVKHCVEGLGEELTSVQTELVNNMWQCYNNGKENLDNIALFLGSYTEKNNQEFQTVKNKINECISITDFGNKTKCAVDATVVIRTAIENYAKNIDETSNGIFNTIKDSVEGTFSCIEQESKNGEENLEKIVDGVVSCLAEGEVPTTTISPETTTPVEDNTDATEQSTGEDLEQGEATTLADNTDTNEQSTGENIEQSTQAIGGE